MQSADTAPKAWGNPVAAFDAWLTRVEASLCAAVLVAEILALCTWIGLKGLASASSSGELSGTVLRALVTCVACGLVAHRLTAPKTATPSPEAERRHAVVTTAAVLGGLLLGRAWVGVGSAYFSNLLNWLQNASHLMLISGVPGLVTRLTLWVALLGASIATSKGKHINVDVVMRFLPMRLRIPVAVCGWVAGAVMCTAAAWGFFDFIGVASFKLPTAVQCADDPAKTCPMPMSKEIGMVAEEVRRDIFLAGRQVSLDLRTGPKVLGGTDYNQVLTGREWNAWLAGSGFEAHFEAEDVERMRVSPDAENEFRTPAVVVPGGSEGVRGLLIRDFDFIFVFGMLMIAFRFLLRAVLAVSGHAKVDPDAMHEEDDLPSQEEEERRSGEILSGGVS